MKLMLFIRSFETLARLLGADQSSGQRINELVFVQSGAGRLTQSGTTTLLQAGDLLINPMGRMDAEQGPVKIVQLLFSETLFSSAVHMDREALHDFGVIKIHARSRNRIRLSSIGTERVGKLLENMEWEYKHKYRGYSWALRLKLIELLITVLRDPQFKIPMRGLKPVTNSRIEEVLFYLHADYMNSIRVEDALQLCGLGRSQFHAVFKTVTGLTFGSYVARLRCTKAAELLVKSNRTVLDVALACGFSNLSHFHQLFKRYMGVSPKQWRNHPLETGPDGLPIPSFSAIVSK